LSLGDLRQIAAGQRGALEIVIDAGEMDSAALLRLLPDRVRSADHQINKLKWCRTK
jgi:hypothetical protein